MKRNDDPPAHEFPEVEFQKILHKALSQAAQVEAKLEQEAEEPHVPLDLAFKQGETIKVTCAREDVESFLVIWPSTKFFVLLNF